jgi:putative ABC transport system substrate-binding protein
LPPTGTWRIKAAVMRIRCLVSAQLVVAGAAAAQQPAQVYRNGYLSAGSATTTNTRPAEALRQGLRELGWVDGRNLAIEYRYAEGPADRLPALAEELVRLKVVVIVASRRRRRWLQ